VPRKGEPFTTGRYEDWNRFDLEKHLASLVFDMAMDIEVIFKAEDPSHKKYRKQMLDALKVKGRGIEIIIGSKPPRRKNAKR
jgi:hypothetical protein